MNQTAIRMLKNEIREKAFQMLKDDRRDELGDTEIEDHYQYQDAVQEYREEFDTKVDLPCKAHLFGYKVCLVAKQVDDRWIAWPYWSTEDIKRRDPARLPWIEYAEYLQLTNTVFSYQNQNLKLQ